MTDREFLLKILEVDALYMIKDSYLVSDDLANAIREVLIEEAMDTLTGLNL